ncbi:MAG: Lrp/AsnC family transcriptional regulator [Thermodesulfobacteriaceae bacterium]|nr:Lrp/AsnC family transcriptional regulator [Thermodesulfobacteriaceae bacterium]MCX8041303.1 Lrp/AsnC family transcriptional regulator [Thermodesulfobacteriaceae bacterium]MDW8135462.1 Lrp/AsnC family transcriptional regulator [Thermodesulfobacterium sp.]
MNLSAKEEKVLNSLIEGIPLVEEPFRKMAEKIQISEEEFLEIAQTLLKKGYLRRIGAILRHNLVGYKGNALVVWKIPEEKVEEIGQFFSSKSFISHCYLRETLPEWPYNLYTMIHAKNEEEVLQMVQKLSQELNLKDYEILFTEKEIIRKHAFYSP